MTFKCITLEAILIMAIKGGRSKPYSGPGQILKLVQQYDFDSFYILIRIVPVQTGTAGLLKRQDWILPVATILQSLSIGFPGLPVCR